MTTDEVRKAIEACVHPGNPDPTVFCIAKLIAFLAQRELERMEAGTDVTLLQLLHDAQYARAQDSLLLQREEWERKRTKS